MEPPRSTVRVLEPAEVAWIAALPCALIVWVAIRVLGSPLGRLLGPGPETFWESARRLPEPTEHAHYLIAVLALPFAAAVVLAGTRARVALRPATIHVLQTAAQVALVAFVLFCLWAQVHDTWPQVTRVIWFFTPRTLVVATLLPLASVLVLRRHSATSAVASATRETSARRIACLAVAVLLTAVWLLTAINSDGTIGLAMANHLIPWDTNEAYAVLDGRTPLVNFHAQYSQLFPYVAALTMALAGSSLGLLTVVMATASGLAQLAVYAIFRRITRSSLLALAIYVPFMATSFFMSIKPLENRLSPSVMFSLWPLRYGGAYLLAWLTARHVDAATPRRPMVLFLTAGLVAINNLEFGAAAFAATFAALLCSAVRSSRELGRLFVDMLVGLLGAVLLVSSLALVRTGQLPRVELLLEFPQLYGKGGWALVPMAPTGLHHVVYVTFVATGLVAVVRAIRKEEPLLTSMLAWSAVFGLLAGSYFAGRSDWLNLIALFSAWSLSLALLSIGIVRTLARRWRRPSVPELAVLFGFGLCVCSVAQLPTPWSQVARLREQTPVPLYHRPGLERFVAQETGRSPKVALILPMGHRIAYDLGKTNISPYSSVESMPTLEQTLATVELLRREHVDRVFLGIQDVTPGNILFDVLDAFHQAGFVDQAQWSDIIELSDTQPG